MSDRDPLEPVIKVVISGPRMSGKTKVAQLLSFILSDCNARPVTQNSKANQFLETRPKSAIAGRRVEIYEIHSPTEVGSIIDGITPEMEKTFDPTPEPMHLHQLSFPFPETDGTIMSTRELVDKIGAKVLDGLNTTGRPKLKPKPETGSFDPDNPPRLNMEPTGKTQTGRPKLRIEAKSFVDGKQPDESVETGGGFFGTVTESKRPRLAGRPKLKST